MGTSCTGTTGCAANHYQSTAGTDPATAQCTACCTGTFLPAAAFGASTTSCNTYSCESSTSCAGHHGCAANFYQASGYQTCTACPTGKELAAQAWSSTATTCVDTKWTCTSASDCSTKTGCAANYVQTSGTATAVGSTANGLCGACPANSTSAAAPFGVPSATSNICARPGYVFVKGSAGSAVGCVANYWHSGPGECTACAAGKETPARTFSNLTAFSTSPCVTDHTCTSSTSCTGKTGCAANYYQATSAHTCTACAPGGPNNQPTFISARAFGSAATMCLNAPGSYSSYYPYASYYVPSPTPAPVSAAVLASNFTASITVTASFNGFANVAAFETWYSVSANQAAMKAGFAYGVTADQIEISNPTASRRRRLTQRRLSAISVTVTIKVQESDKAQVLAHVTSTTASTLTNAIATTLIANNVGVNGFAVATVQQPVAVAPTPSPTPQGLAPRGRSARGPCHAHVCVIVSSNIQLPSTRPSTRPSNLFNMYYY